MTSKIVLSTYDYTGSTLIQLTEDTASHFYGHLGQFTPDLADTIKGNLVEPEVVLQSQKFADTKIYCRFDVLGGELTSHWLHVVVSQQLYYGSVVSAYAGKTLKKGTPIYIKAKR